MKWSAYKEDVNSQWLQPLAVYPLSKIYLVKKFEWVWERSRSKQGWGQLDQLQAVAAV